jgi:hypothetical protein
MRRRTPHLMLLARRRPPSVQQALRPARARGRPQAKGSAPAARKHPAPQCRSAGPPDRNPHAHPERSTLSGPRSLSIFDLLQEGFQLRTGISMATAIVSKGGAFRPQSLSSLIPSIGARIKSRFRGPNLRLLDLTMAAAKAAPTKNGFCRRGFSPNPCLRWHNDRGESRSCNKHMDAEMNFGLQPEGLPPRIFRHRDGRRLQGFFRSPPG